MLKQFQYTSIALLCSMAVACSSGGKGGQKPSPNQNPPRAEQPQPQPQPQAPRQEAQPDQAVPPKTDLAPNAPQQNGQADQPKAESEPKKDQQAGQQMPPKLAEPAPSQPNPPVAKPMEPAVFTVTVQDIAVTDHDVEATKENYKNGIEKFLVTDGKLNLNNPKSTLTVSDVKGSVIDDIGLSLLSADSTSISQGFSKIKVFGDVQSLASSLLVRDMDVNQWKYQTFGTYFEHATGANGFVSFGEESKVIPNAGTVKYNGIAFGSALENSKPVSGLGQIASEVKISADFNQKSLTFETSNTKGFRIDGEFVDPSTRVLDHSAWDLKGTATWNGDKKAFEGKVQLKTETGNPSEQSLLKGSFYGSNAAEIGGTFHLKDANKDYRGAFGGKKEEAPAVQGK